jgi:hypothetical protein
MNIMPCVFLFHPVVSIFEYSMSLLVLSVSRGGHNGIHRWQPYGPSNSHTYSSFGRHMHEPVLCHHRILVYKQPPVWASCVLSQVATCLEHQIAAESLKGAFPAPLPKG